MFFYRFNDARSSSASYMYHVPASYPASDQDTGQAFVLSEGVTRLMPD